MARADFAGAKEFQGTFNAAPYFSTVMDVKFVPRMLIQEVAAGAQEAPVAIKFAVCSLPRSIPSVGCHPLALHKRPAFGRACPRRPVSPIASPPVSGFSMS